MISDKQVKNNLISKLLRFIKTMDIPVFRKTRLDKYNLIWISDNLGTRNSTNSNYQEAIDIVTILLKNKWYDH